MAKKPYLAFEEIGTGRPLILVHGYPLDHSIWMKTASLLSAEFRVVLPDLRGYGASASLGISHSMDEMAEDVRDLLDSLQIERALLAGHSMGGYVIQNFLRLFPERVAGMVLVNSICFADAPERKEARRKLAAEIEQRGPMAVVEASLAKYSPDEKVRETCRRIMLHPPREAVAASSRAMADRLESCSVLAGASQPLVALYGDQDGFIPLERSEEMLRAVPKMKGVLLPGVGHTAMLEVPEKVAEVLRELAGEAKF